MRCLAGPTYREALRFRAACAPHTAAWARDHARSPSSDPLAIAALDTERHVAAGGWDQPPRLFALVRTADLLEREPQLRGADGDRTTSPTAP